MTVTAVATVAGLAAAAAVLACVRFGVAEKLNGPLPYGTLLVNVAASGLLGALSRLDEPWLTIVGVGALGTLSTWSAVAVEVGRMARAGDGQAAALYLLATVTTGLVAAWLGLQIAAL
jgi:CrcB protein